MRFVEHRIACIFTFRQRLFEKLPDGEGALSVAGSERATVAGGHERKAGLSQRCAESVFFEAGGGRAREAAGVQHVVVLASAGALRDEHADEKHH